MKTITTLLNSVGSLFAPHWTPVVEHVLSSFGPDAVARLAKIPGAVQCLDYGLTQLTETASKSLEDEHLAQALAESDVFRFQLRCLGQVWSPLSDMGLQEFLTLCGRQEVCLFVDQTTPRLTRELYGWMSLLKNAT